MTATAKRPASSGLSFALDFGPLLVFFLFYRFGGGLIMGTAAFMVAIALAVVVSRVRLGKVSPMLWLSAALVLGFGSLTIWFNDPAFIQVKPTIIYLLFAVTLFGGLLLKRPLLRDLLGAAFEGMSEAGWMKLSRNWALFFLAMAALNEAIRLSLSFDTWLTLKVWGVTVLSFLFGLANLPMMIKHGLRLGDEDKVEAKPPEG